MPLYKSVRPSESSEPKGQRAGHPPAPLRFWQEKKQNLRLQNAFKLLHSGPPKFSGLPTALGPSYHVVVEKSDGLNFHAKQIAHANVLILVDVEGGLIKATKMLEKYI